MPIIGGVIPLAAPGNATGGGNISCGWVFASDFGAGAGPLA